MLIGSGRQRSYPFRSARHIHGVAKGAARIAWRLTRLPTGGGADHLGT